MKQIAWLLVLHLLLLGCGQRGGLNKSGPSTPHHDHGPGPHGGTIADWGSGKYHIEFTVDHARQEAAVYILRGDAKTAAPIKADKLLLTIKEPAFEVELRAVPQQGDPPGTASCFVGKHEHLGKEQEFAGSVRGEIDGQPYIGHFQEKPEEPGKK